MPRSAGLFIPTYQGLSPVDLLRSARSAAPCFPFDVPNRLPFYRARNAIYHLFRALLATQPRLTVLAPDYNSGNEILAMRAAGATIRYCPVDREMRLDPDRAESLCKLHDPDLLYVIHYVGWPQPMPALVDLCRRREMLLVEDCALALLSALGDRPLGTFGQWAVFCLYKTLSLPNGALLVQNGNRLESLERLRLRSAGAASVLGRTLELLLQRLRGRSNALGAALLAMKRAMGRAAGALNVPRAGVGEIGFDLGHVDLAMSRLSERLLSRFDLDEIRRRRIANYRWLTGLLNDHVTPVFPELPDGVCPLFLPVIVGDKHAACEELHARGVAALEFWNHSVESGSEMSAAARYLRAHVLELPIHQDVNPAQLAFLARQVNRSLCSGSTCSSFRR
jgi:dTDP-4-amino-4,6-dideoxygalactose transaminase